MIADSSAWIEYLQATGSPVDQAMQLALVNRQRITVLDVVLQEVLQGASSQKHFDRLDAQLAALPRFSPPDPRMTHRAAAALYMRCRQRGVTVRRANDCLIAALAIESNEPVLQRDRDFAAIASIDPRLKLLALP